MKQLEVQIMGQTYVLGCPWRDALALEAGLRGGIEKNVSWFASASVQTGNRAEALHLPSGLKAKW